MTHRAAALLLLVGTVLVVRRTMDQDIAAEVRGTALGFGFALIAAILAGDLVERLRLPRISGYLLFGLAVGPYAGDLISRAMASDLQLVNGLAIALIAFIAGLEINFARIRSRLTAIATVSAWVIGTAYVVLAAAAFVAWPWLPFAPDAEGVLRAGMALVVATVLVSFSPTVTIAVIAESRSRGALSDLALTVVVLGDLALILSFTLVMEFMRYAAGARGAAGVGLIPHLSWEILGSLAFGALAGAIFAFYLRLVSRELTIVLIGLCVLVSTAGSILHFEPLLSALAAGLVVENIAPPRGDALKTAVAKGALPVLVVFFATAGASVQLDALASLGLLAIAVALVRAGGIWLGARVGLRRAGMLAAPAPMLWMALISQAGVTLGLGLIVAIEFPDWGGRLQTLIVALIAIHELAGPILFRAALAKAGEVGQMAA